MIVGEVKAHPCANGQILIKYASVDMQGGETAIILFKGGMDIGYVNLSVFKEIDRKIKERKQE